jgi:hypothetical protein
MAEQVLLIHLTHKCKWIHEINFPKCQIPLDRLNSVLQSSQSTKQTCRNLSEFQMLTCAQHISTELVSTLILYT